MKFSKKCLALILMLAVLMLPACGNGENAGSATEEAAKANALDLTGSWVAEVQGNDYYLAGFIEDDLIELHWVSNYDQYGSVYWAGTYKAPKEETDTYSWSSERDEEIMATTTYGAPDDKRHFRYEDGKLILEAGLQGYEVVLVPSEIDYTGLAVQIPGRDKDKDKDKDKDDKKDKDGKKDKVDKEEEKSETSVTDNQAAKEESVKNAKLMDSGYAIEHVGNGVSMVYYGVEIANLNKYNAITSPTIEITVRAKDGSLVSKQKKTISGIAPDTTVIFGDAIKCKNGKADEVEIKVKNADYDIVPYDGSGVHSPEDLEISHVKEKHDNKRAVYTGKITNTTGKDIPGVLVSVVYYKNGKIVGGATERLDSISANGEAEFEIQNSSTFNDYDEYEVYATVES